MDSLNNEIVFFSCSIQKINRSNKTQDRFILITDKYFYQLKESWNSFKIKKKFSLINIHGITSSKVDKTRLIIHIYHD